MVDLFVDMAMTCKSSIFFFGTEISWLNNLAQGAFQSLVIFAAFDTSKFAEVNKWGVLKPAPDHEDIAA